MSDYRHKRPNVSVLMSPSVCPAQYRRVIVDAEVDTVRKDVCFDIAKRYAMAFLAIGTDKAHGHLLVQSVPSSSPTKMVTRITGPTARAILPRGPTVTTRLGGGRILVHRLLHQSRRPARECSSHAPICQATGPCKRLSATASPGGTVGVVRRCTQRASTRHTMLHPAKLAGQGCTHHDGFRVEGFDTSQLAAG